ncbi:hypothetical protein GCM10010532_096190 [Dactylosporangium siamense]
MRARAAVSMPSDTPTSPSATSPSSDIYMTNLGWGTNPAGGSVFVITLDAATRDRPSTFGSGAARP